MKTWIQTPLARALAAVAVIVALGCVFNAEGAFFRWNTHRDMLRQASIFGILGCGMTIVILTGGIDLSVGSVVGLVAVAFSILTIHWRLPAALALPMALAVGAALGAISGLIVAGFGVQPFIATLAMMVFGRGLAKWFSGGQKITTAVELEDGSFDYVADPRIFELIDSRIFDGNLAVVTMVFLGCVAICWFVLELTAAGRYVMAIGGNEEAARLSGVRVGRIKVLAYALSGLFAAVAGICQAAQEFQGDPEAGATYELTAIAIVVIGGTSLMGGRGGVLLTLVGALTIGYLEKILSINAVGEAGRLVLTGLIIIGAVLFQRQGRKR